MLTSPFYRQPFSNMDYPSNFTGKSWVHPLSMIFKESQPSYKWEGVEGEASQFQIRYYSWMELGLLDISFIYRRIFWSMLLTVVLDVPNEIWENLDKVLLIFFQPYIWQSFHGYIIWFYTEITLKNKVLYCPSCKARLLPLQFKWLVNKFFLEL